jgi:hypothetical protein
MSKEAFSSITMPSICTNSGRWVESMASLRKTRERENTLTGGSGCLAR